MRPRLRLRAPPLTTLPVLGIVLAAGALVVEYASQAREWAVMTDELQTSKLATSIAETLSPVPHIHGQYYGALNQLYPLVLSPLYGLLSAPAAFTGAHVLNAFLLASSAWPAYLLGREVTASRAGGFLAASLTAFVPWLVLSSTLLTENVAYPVFVWSALLCYRTIVEPGVGRDAAALAGLVLAYLARTQLFVLAPALALSVVGHELGFAAATAGAGRKGLALRAALRHAVGRHRLLTAAYGSAAAGAALLAGLRSLTRVFGNYAGTLSGNPFPAGIWHAAAVHLDYAVVGTGVASFLLAAAWSIGTLLDPWRRESHAYAALFVTLVPLVTLEAASFDLRFTPGRFVQDRYVSYLAPLFAVGAAACLLDRRRRGLRAGLVLAVGLAFFGLAALATYGEETALYWASPAAAFHRALRGTADAIGLSAVDLVRWGGLLLSGVLAGALWRLPSRATLAVLGIALTGFGAFEAGYVFDWFAVPGTTRPRTIPGVRRDWIDAELPANASVALVPNAHLRAEYWWDAEFWNKTVDRALAVDERPIFTPFASSKLSFDADTGEVHGAEPTDLLVLDSAEARFGLVGTVRLARARPLVLVRVARPYRAAWLVLGAEPDGWIRPGTAVQIRVFGGRRDARQELVVSLRAPFEATRPQRFFLRSGGSVVGASVLPGGVVSRRSTTCTSARGFGSATLLARGGARLPDRRVVSLHLDRVELRSRPGRCRAR
jgi:hypothetical protein